MSRSAVAGSTQDERRQQEEHRAAHGRRDRDPPDRVAAVARAPRRRPRQRDREEDRVVVRRERDAGDRAPAATIATELGPLIESARLPTPEPVVGQIRQHDQERHRHVVLHVVRVQHVQRRDGEQQRGRTRPASRPLMRHARAEDAGRDHGRRAQERRQQTSRHEDARRIEEELALEAPNDATDRVATARDRRQPLPREQRVEVEGRIQEIVRVEIPLRERQRARHDRDFVRVVDRRQPVAQPVEPQSQRDAQTTSSTPARAAPAHRSITPAARHDRGDGLGHIRGPRCRWRRSRRPSRCCRRLGVRPRRRARRRSAAQPAQLLGVEEAGDRQQADEHDDHRACRARGGPAAAPASIADRPARLNRRQHLAGDVGRDRGERDTRDAAPLVRDRVEALREARSRGRPARA